MKIEIGKSYETAKGDVVKVLYREGGLLYCDDKRWREENGSNSYIKDGNLICVSANSRPNEDSDDG